MSRCDLLAHRLIALCALATAVAVVDSIAAPLALAEPGQKFKPPTLLWKSYPLKPRPRPTGQAVSRNRQATQQTSTDKTRFPSPLLVSMFLAALLALGTTVLVWLRLVPIGVRGPRRRRAPPTKATAPDPGDDLLEALQPEPRPSRPDPEPVPEPVVSDRARMATQTRGPVVDATATRQQPKHRRRTHSEDASVARCEIKLWRGFVKCQLYAVPDGSEDAAIAFSPYFRLRDDDASSPQAEHALSALVATLERDGWTVVSDGPSWYQYRLERSE